MDALASLAGNAYGIISWDCKEHPQFLHEPLQDEQTEDQSC